MNNVLSLPIRNPEIARSVFYALERRHPEARFEWQEGASSVRCAGVDAATAQRSIDEFVSVLGKVADRVSGVTLFETSDQAPLQAEMQDQVIAQEVPGTYLLLEELQETAALLDGVFAGFARRLLARPIALPSLVSRQELLRAGYLPRERHQIGSVRVWGSDDSEESQVCLSPAVCLSCYPALGRRGQDETDRLYTAYGKVFRHEGGVFSRDLPLSRLWEYHVREIVGFGDERFEAAVRNEYILFLSRFAERLALPAEIGTAADLFFHAEHSKQAIHQLLHQSKLEFRVRVGATKLAASSFNSHGRHFVEEFRIQGRAGGLRSFCIGFGIERMAQSVMLAIPCRNERLARLESLTEGE